MWHSARAFLQGSENGNVPCHMVDEASSSPCLLVKKLSLIEDCAV